MKVESTIVLVANLVVVIVGEVLFNLALHGRVPVIFDGIVRPSRQQLGNLSPSIALITMILQYRSILLATPSLLTNIRIQMIMPPFSTLLSNPPWQMGRNHTPLLGTIFFDQAFNGEIFLGGPWSFDECWFGELLPFLSNSLEWCLGPFRCLRLIVVGGSTTGGRTNRWLRDGKVFMTKSIKCGKFSTRLMRATPNIDGRQK
mmetsp:Transcript_18411/g.32390  ORF Transcript_18411/g.32390 Transcript_18411/m.32390 type:complete len:202 (+) Transcript_18411:63-668(+)